MFAISLQARNTSFAAAVPAIQASATEQSRARRIATLLFAVAAMNIADLIFTLTYATSIGMGEMNPIARMLMHNTSVPYIIFFKLLAVSIGCGLLFIARRTRMSEIATWIAFFGLLALTIRWVQYASIMDQIGGNIRLLADNQPQNWVNIPSN